MTEDAPDTTTLTGAKFLRHAGTDAEKWAEAFWQAYSREERERPETERQQKSHGLGAFVHCPLAARLC